MKRVLVTLIFATLAGALVFGAAASLNVGSNDLGSGSDVVAACDTTDTDVDGSNIDVAYDLSGSDPTKVTGVIVSDIDDTNCAGQTVYAVVSDGTNPLGSQSDNVGGTSLSLTFGSPVEASAITGVAVTITGTDPTP